MDDDKVRQNPAPIKARPAASPPPLGDWADVSKFAIVAAVMLTLAMCTDSASTAVMVGSPLVALLRR